MWIFADAIINLMSPPYVISKFFEAKRMKETVEVDANQLQAEHDKRWGK